MGKVAWEKISLLASIKKMTNVKKGEDASKCEKGPKNSHYKIVLWDFLVYMLLDNPSKVAYSQCGLEFFYYQGTSRIRPYI